MHSQGLAVDAFEGGVVAAAENAEEIVEFKMPQAGQFQLQQCRLTGVGVDCIDLRHPGQGVVEHIAACAGDDQHVVFRLQVEGPAVDGRVFPAGVVDQRTPVDPVEDSLVNPINRALQQGFAPGV